MDGGALLDGDSDRSADAPLARIIYRADDAESRLVRLARGPAKTLYVTEQRKDGALVGLYLHRVDMEGRRLWRTSVIDGLADVAPWWASVGPDGGVWVPAEVPGTTTVATAFVARLSADGVVLWSHRAGPGFDGAAGAVAAGGSRYYFSAGKLVALDLDGKEAWAVDRGTLDMSLGPGYSVSSPSVGPDGAIYVGGHNGALLCFETDGRQRWQWVARIRGLGLRSPTLGGSFVVVGQAETVVHVVGTDGAFRWTNVGGNSEALVDSSGRLRIRNENGDYAYDSSGTFLWQHKLPIYGGLDGPLARYRAPSLDASDTMVATSMNIVWLRVSGDGSYLPAPEASAMQEPLIDEGRVLFITRDERSIALAEVPIARLGKSAWPSWHHDECNTRNTAADWCPPP